MKQNLFNISTVFRICIVFCALGLALLIPSGCAYMMENDSGSPEILSIEDFQGCFYEEYFSDYSDETTPDTLLFGSLDCRKVCVYGDSVVKLRYTQYRSYMTKDSSSLIPTESPSKRDTIFSTLKILEPEVDGFFRKNISGFDWDVCKTENHVVYCRERRSVNHETVEVWAEIKREANLCNAF